jgi:hypothetical protein
MDVGDGVVGTGIRIADEVSVGDGATGDGLEVGVNDGRETGIGSSVGDSWQEVIITSPMMSQVQTQIRRLEIHFITIPPTFYQGFIGLIP